MSDPKPLASLSSSLLARKGGAKPAMRRQGYTNFPDHGSDLDGAIHEDLGWDDMGYDVDPDHDAHPVEHIHNPLAGAIPNPGAAVRQQQEEIAAKLGVKPSTEDSTKTDAENAGDTPVPLSISRDVQTLAKKPSVLESARLPKAEPRKPRPATKSRTRKAKTAFTLRLDPERHLKLRLATAVKNISAQQLVTRAVDEYLKTIPELDDLAERVPSRGSV
ncbi:hypothetical protein [Sphingorhabdus sp. YGSMI21]|uniref:hypothetical protein n=1 Tax=Sphingorhabdus sp. YGSMI21 TaxID=2077182 RepID=UPI000C1DD4B9|nr:hypothetical protein [Sphingorhabdus sp. YGSMI21]ATW05619.1 hypothetical protein CHN51_15750 [Sphingorhabdus sp. YGSMI21]